ncbi:MAG: hypothetical protein JRI23_26030, partial [Deltaproteobacteria bacterium]|nr:hypothetical protein [Deltaproteobacteria bacterium]MBW2535488.1 hypothetical protein [Deltaproteobacteria bacterium]
MARRYLSTAAARVAAGWILTFVAACVAACSGDDDGGLGPTSTASGIAGQGGTAAGGTG